MNSVYQKNLINRYLD